MAMTGGTPYLLKSTTAQDGATKISLYLYVKETVNISSNTSTVKLGMYVDSNYGIGAWGDFNGSYVGISASKGSNRHDFDGSIGYGSGQRWLVENVEYTVQHDADGKKNLTIYWHWGVNSPWGRFENPSGSKSITLTPIARASQPRVADSSSGGNVVSSSQVGKYIYIQTQTASSTFKHKLTYDIGSLKGQTAGLDSDASTGFTNWTGFTPPQSLLKVLSGYAGDKATVTFNLTTYSDNTYKTIIGTKTTTFTLTGTGYVSIDNGSSFSNYIAFVDNGSSWDRVVPYVDSGSAWNLY